MMKEKLFGHLIYSEALEEIITGPSFYKEETTNELRCIGCSPTSHIFIWSATENNPEIPEGLPCVCGKYVAHYENCPTCGSKIVKLVRG